MKKAIKHLSIFFTIIFFSCIDNYQTTKSIPGYWMIDNISYKKIDYKDSLRYNMLFFEFLDGERIVKLPKTTYSNRVISKWNQLEDNYILINSSNKVFDGKFKVKYFDDKERNLIGAIFKSNNTTIEAYKLGNDYSSEYE
ncbi:hypothetical protein [Flavobacterium sp. CS20]|uniref:hypothetical protein n=1 Tax=Flavobacterium sp. CS20 TaxID=2775246 RepID=UPI001B3A1C40|nr:hypothetical protein [Flavobacterium sp. CS20]QTY27316.1 hypothetical protein IGB25_01665 [Flavobacterium sp. CS20]